MTYDQQKREAIANAKHLVELLQDLSGDCPETTEEDREDLRQLSNAIKTATHYALTMLDREANPH